MRDNGAAGKSMPRVFRWSSIICEDVSFLCVERWSEKGKCPTHQVFQQQFDL